MYEMLFSFSRCKFERKTSNQKSCLLRNTVQKYKNFGNQRRKGVKILSLLCKSCAKCYEIEDYRYFYIPNLRSPTRSLCVSPMPHKGTSIYHHPCNICPNVQSGWHRACPFTGQPQIIFFSPICYFYVYYIKMTDINRRSVLSQVIGVFMITSFGFSLFSS